MKTKLVLFSFLLPILCFSQGFGTNNLLPSTSNLDYESHPAKKKSSDDIYSTRNLFLGYENVNLNSLNTYLFNGKTKGFSSNLLLYGFDAEVFPLSKQGKGVVNFLEYTYFQPQKISISDTSYTLSGWQGHLMHFGFDVFPKSKNVDFTFLGGFEYGRLKLLREALGSGVKTTYTNSLFALNVSTELHFNFFPFKDPLKGFGIGGQSGYNLDLTNLKWKNKSGGPSDLPSTKLSGINYSVLLLFYF